jgi:alkylhydroperoxidase family enzyme
LGRYFTAEQITDLMLSVATAIFTNRFNEGMRTPVDT